ncbi:MAG TPA: ribose 5-phosphate isomerase B [Candidatus Omnitrophota bacterium]|nr:ribose 5-phosphate isomerase B [Candidatus Omnitrophota bacterium]
MKIFIGADHRGFYLKAKIIKALAAKGFEMVDVGTDRPQKPCDYPQFSYKVGKGVVSSRGARGILVCMSGIGHSIAANRIKGVRAALCYNVKAAELSRAHNDANVLVLGAKFVSVKDIDRIIRVWLVTPFEGGRHLRRIKQIDRLTCAKRA